MWKAIATVVLCLVSGPILLSAQDPPLVNGSMTIVGPVNYCGADTGTGNAYACQNTSVSARQIKSLVAGNRYRFKATHANTGAATLSIDGLTGTAIKKISNNSVVDLIAGDIANGAMVDLIYDSTYFQYQTPPPTAGTGSTNYAAGNDSRFNVVSNSGTVNSVPAKEVLNVPQPDLSSYFEVLHNAAYQRVVITIFGDSISRCFQGSPTPCGAGPLHATSLWSNALRTMLQGEYGNGGIGMLPLMTTYLGGSSEYVDASTWTMSGTYSYSTLIGPQQSTANSNGGALIQLSNGATATLTSQTYDNINIYYGTTSGSGTLSVSIDGSSAGSTSATSSSPTAQIASFSTTLGSHTTVLSCSGTCYLYAAEPTIGTTGVVVENMAVGGAVSSFFGAGTGMAFANLIPGFSSLGIVMLGTNDAGTGQSVSTYTAGMNGIVSNLQAHGSSVLLMNEPPVISTYGGTMQPSYWAAANGIAQTTGAGLISTADRWGSYTQTYAAGLLNSDGIHPSDKGSLDIASQVEARLVDVVPASSLGVFNGGTVSNPITVQNSGTASFRSITTSNGGTAATSWTTPTQAWLTEVLGSSSGSIGGPLLIQDLTTSPPGGYPFPRPVRELIVPGGGFAVGDAISDASTYAGSTLLVIGNMVESYNSNTSGNADLKAYTRSTTGFDGARNLLATPTRLYVETLFTQSTGNNLGDGLAMQDYSATPPGGYPFSRPIRSFLQTNGDMHLAGAISDGTGTGAGLSIRPSTSSIQINGLAKVYTGSSTPSIACSNGGLYLYTGGGGGFYVCQSGAWVLK